MKGNRINHPSRLGQPLKPDKAKRTATQTFFLTPDDKQKLQAIVKAQGVSFNDWLSRQINQSL